MVENRGLEDRLEVGVGGVAAFGHRLEEFGDRDRDLDVGLAVLLLGQDDALHGLLADAGALEGALKPLDVLDLELDGLVLLELGLVVVGWWMHPGRVVVHAVGGAAERRQVADVAHACR